jgi:hypothetical protein
MWCSKGEKANTFDGAMKRFLVLRGISRMSGHSGLLALGKELSEPNEKANHKIVLRKARQAYNYRA